MAAPPRWCVRSRLCGIAHGRAGCQIDATYNGRMLRAFALATASSVIATVALGQTPQPFPRPGTQPSQPSQPSQPPPAQTSPPPAAPATVPPPADFSAPTEAMLGVPLYPTGQFLASYDAGRGQRYYLFGSTAMFADLVAYYRN